MQHVNEGWSGAKTRYGGNGANWSQIGCKTTFQPRLKNPKNTEFGRVWPSWSGVVVAICGRAATFSGRLAVWYFGPARSRGGELVGDGDVAMGGL